MQSRYTLALGLGLFTLLLLVARADARTYDNPEFSRIASSIIGSPVTVHCVPNDQYNYGYTLQNQEEDGSLDFDPDIYLEHEICDSLNLMLHHKFRRGKGYDAGSGALSSDGSFALGRNYMMGVALITLTHEAGHIKLNSGDEAVVECWAVRHMRSVLKDYFTLPGWLSRIIISSALDAHTQSDPQYREIC